ncbi:MAG: signal peptide peptidase SppA [Heliobacteriaceae bacterium]|nr:signal peptide peptidase SppA [Heliobacteriaceae bacterium]
MARGKKWVAGIILALVLGSLVFLAVRGTGEKVAGPTGKSNMIALVRIEGVITGTAGGNSLMGATSGGLRLLETLRQIQEDPQVKAVVLRINSPGGTAATAQEISDEVDRLRQSGKVVVASLGDMAASGGYWIAARADKIVAAPASTTGSIGVILDIANLTELYQKIGYRSEVIKSGPYKDMLSSAREMTPEERQILKAMIDDIYNQFIDVVSEGRNLPPEKVRALGDGRIYTGRQAKDLGLVDELGNYFDAIDLAASLAGIEGRPQVQEYGKGSPWERFLTDWTSGAGLWPGSNMLPGLSPAEISRLLPLWEKW